MHIYNNVFKDNGGSPQLPDPKRNPCHGPNGAPDPRQGDAADCASGNRPHYFGSTERYGIPSAGACLLCHGGDDREPGTAPIGPKVRYLNRNNSYGGVSMNQLAYMQAHGLLDLPADKLPAQLETFAQWNVPGSGGDAANSAPDKNKRARACLEVNCMHCHNAAGGAQNSGLRLNSFGDLLGSSNGICKPLIAAGKGADSGTYDIQPGSSGISILVNRVASVTPGIRMPPTARTVMQAEAVTLLTDSVDHVVTNYADPKANTCSGSTPGAGIPLPAGTLPAYLIAPLKAVPELESGAVPFG